MDYISCRERTFPLQLAQGFVRCYRSYAYWLQRLLERLGREATVAVWQSAYADYDAALLMQILAAEWGPVTQDEVDDTEGQISDMLSALFTEPVADVSREQAGRIIDATPPVHQIRESCPSLDVWRETTAFEALHLAFDGLALLIESLIDRHGKQGELIAYDLLSDQRVAAREGQTGSAEEFIANFTSEPAEPNIFTAGLELEVLHASAREILMQVKECEWARYFQERHPRVGYLMACSTDEVAYKAFNASLRLQRTSTLMEGGKACDFRIYAVGVDEASANKDE